MKHKTLLIIAIVICISALAVSSVAFASTTETLVGTSGYTVREDISFETFSQLVGGKYNTGRTGVTLLDTINEIRYCLYINMASVGVHDVITFEVRQIDDITNKLLQVVLRDTGDIEYKIGDSNSVADLSIELMYSYLVNAEPADTFSDSEFLSIFEQVPLPNFPENLLVRDDLTFETLNGMVDGYNAPRQGVTMRDVETGDCYYLFLCKELVGMYDVINLEVRQTTDMSNKLLSIAFKETGTVTYNVGASDSISNLQLTSWSYENGSFSETELLQIFAQQSETPTFIEYIFAANGGVFENGETTMTITTPSDTPLSLDDLPIVTRIVTVTTYPPLGTSGPSYTTEERYEFLGWHYGPLSLPNGTLVTDGGFYAPDDFVGYNGPLSLTAQWGELLSTYTVTLTCDCGECGADNTTQHSYLQGSEVSELPVLSREGYIFGGWYYDSTDPNGSNYTTPFAPPTTVTEQEETEGPNGLPILIPVERERYVLCETPFTVTGDLLLFPKWTRITFDITCIERDYEEIHTVKKVGYGDTFAYEPTRTGYSFSGWVNTETGEPFDADTQVYSDLSLTATWTANKYEVTFYYNDETQIVSADYCTPFENFLFTPTKKGYDFLGWYYDAECTRPLNLISVPDYNVELYAAWQAHEYTIRFDVNGGEGSLPSINAVYDEPVTLEYISNSVAFEGHDFLGWATSSTGKVVYLDGQTVVNIAPINSETVTLYAVWEIQHFKVTFMTRDKVLYEIDVEYGTDLKTLIDQTVIEELYYVSGDYSGKVTSDTVVMLEKHEVTSAWDNLIQSRIGKLCFAILGIALLVLVVVVVIRIVKSIFKKRGSKK